MASFWQLSDGEQVGNETSYEAPSGGGDYIFADGAKVTAVIDKMEWTSFNGGEEFINIQWTVMAPEKDADGVKIANRKIFQKVYPNGDAERQKTPEKIEKKANNAKRMLGAMAANAGGGLMKVQGQPTNDDFAQHMLMKPMSITLGVWDMETNGEKRKGNWVRAVGKADMNAQPPAGAAKPVQKASSMSQGSALDDEIPFSPCF